jgi:hypothetical protein
MDADALQLQAVRSAITLQGLGQMVPEGMLTLSKVEEIKQLPPSKADRNALIKRAAINQKHVYRTMSSEPVLKQKSSKVLKLQ